MRAILVVRMMLRSAAARREELTGMSQIASAHPRPDALHPPAISLRELWPWTVLAMALLMLVYIVTVFDSHLAHEFFHDGRHLLAFPCH